MSDLEEQRALYPRVSHIIEKQNFNELKAVSLEILANACLRGQKVHDYCTAWAKNLWVSDIEEEYQPYFDAFVYWAIEHIDELLYSCTRLYDDELKFTGEFDMIVKMKRTNKIVLLDIKTSSAKSKAWPVQLAAYGHLCQKNGLPFDQIMNLHLKKTHPALYEIKEEKKVMISPPQVKACAIEYGDSTPYWEIFSSCLTCYDYFDRKGVK